MAQVQLTLTIYQFSRFRSTTEAYITGNYKGKVVHTSGTTFYRTIREAYKDGLLVLDPGLYLAITDDMRGVLFTILDDRSFIDGVAIPSLNITRWPPK